MREFLKRKNEEGKQLIKLRTLFQNLISSEFTWRENVFEEFLIEFNIPNLKIVNYRQYPKIVWILSKQSVLLIDN